MGTEETVATLSEVWDWDFMWSTFGFILKLVSPFVMVVVAVIVVGLLLTLVIKAVQSRGG